MTVAADDAGEPAWFRRALENAPDVREHTVDGCRLRYRAWGKPDSPGLILIHGGGAHSGWWDHIAPLLDSHRVIAPDLSGHGDSAWRDGPAGYSASGWAGEITAVAAAEGLDRPVVIGHSMGGFVAAATAAFQDTPLGGAVIIDTPLNDNPPEEAVLRQRRRPTRVYPSREEAVARFRTVPEQDVLLPYVAQHIARESLRPADGGWTWKFDPNRRGTATSIRSMLPKISVPVALLRCEQGLLPPERAREMAGLAGGAPVITLPGTGHHPMLDQPLALVTALRSVLALWAAQTTRLPAPALNGSFPYGAWSRPQEVFTRASPARRIEAPGGGTGASIRSG
jgi:pimeloyl-ACP methyl ester carboxylesterase